MTDPAPNLLLPLAFIGLFTLFFWFFWLLPKAWRLVFWFFRR